MKFKILFLALLLLVSCSDQPPEGDLVRAPFVGGVIGLKTGLLDGMPPPAVTDAGTNPFSVGVSLENVGEADVGPGTANPYVLVRLSGIVPDNWDMTKEDMSIVLTDTITGAKKNFDGTILPGGVGVATFEGLNYQFRVADSELFRMHAEVCYDYHTESTMRVCVKDDVIENIQDDTLCKLRSDLLPKNSGGPLQVTEADQNPVGDRGIQVNYVIANLNEGVFFDRTIENPDEACGFDVQNPHMYKALIVVHSVDPVNYELDCRGLDNTKPGFEDVPVPADSEYGVLKFSGNRPRSLTCFINKESEISGRVFQDLLDIDIYYRYAEFVEIPVLVQNVHLS